MTSANLPREARALLDAIAQGESDPSAKREGISPYVILYGGGSFEGMPDRTGYNGFPEWAGKDNSHAAGRYQFEPATWRGIVPRFGPAIPNFRNPDDQDWGAWFLAQQDYQARSGAPLLNALQVRDIGGIGGVLQPTWTSMSNVTFSDRYAMALALLLVDAPPVPAAPPAPPTSAPAVAPSVPPALGTSDVIGGWIRLGQDILSVAHYYDGPVDGRPNDAMIEGLQKYLDWLDAGSRP